MYHIVRADDIIRGIHHNEGVKIVCSYVSNRQPKNENNYDWVLFEGSCIALANVIGIFPDRVIALRVKAALELADHAHLQKELSR